MPRPKTKTELLDAAEAQYAKLDSLIEGMSSNINELSVNRKVGLSLTRCGEGKVTDA